MDRKTNREMSISSKIKAVLVEVWDDGANAGLYGDNGNTDKKMATDQAFASILKIIEEEMPEAYEIAHILSNQEGIGAYTPEQLKKAIIIRTELLKKLRKE